MPAALPMIKPYLIIRAISGALIVLAGILHAWNTYKTVTAGERVAAGAPAGVEAPGVAAEVAA